MYKSIWTAAVVEEFEALAKGRYRDIVSTSSCASDCVWCRSKVTLARKKKFVGSNFRSFYFRITIRDGAYEIYEN